MSYCCDCKIYVKNKWICKKCSQLYMENGGVMSLILRLAVDLPNQNISHKKIFQKKLNESVLK